MSATVQGYTVHNVEINTGYQNAVGIYSGIMQMVKCSTRIFMRTDFRINAEKKSEICLHAIIMNFRIV